MFDRFTLEIAAKKLSLLLNKFELTHKAKKSIPRRSFNRIIPEKRLKIAHFYAKMSQISNS